MNSTDHFYLQVFRTICREIYTKRHYIQKLRYGVEDYCKLRDAFLVARMNVANSGRPIHSLGVKFENDPIERLVIDQQATLSRTLTSLERLYEAVLNALENKDADIVLMVKKYDIKLPLCLSGVGGLSYRWEGAQRHAMCVLAVIPECGYTNVIIGAERAHEGFLERYMHNDTSTAVNRLRELAPWRHVNLAPG